MRMNTAKMKMSSFIVFFVVFRLCLLKKKKKSTKNVAILTTL